VKKYNRERRKSPGISNSSDSADEKREEIIHRLLSLHNGTWSHLRLTTSSPFSGSLWPHHSPSSEEKPDKSNSGAF